MLANPTRHWTHRIDAVPQVGRHVQISLAVGGRLLMATVLPANEVEREQFKGIGSEVVYQSNGRRYLARDVAHWRYR